MLCSFQIYYPINIKKSMCADNIVHYNLLKLELANNIVMVPQKMILKHDIKLHLKEFHSK